MSIKGYDFELNGVYYNAAEDAEGDHYALGAEPLRPPNAVTVQGESQQKFQMRPDTLLWTLTDWSGGEGQRKFNPQEPNRHFELNGVRVFERPGTLQPGYYVEDSFQLDESDMTEDILPVVSNQSMYGYDKNNNGLFTWNPVSDGRWSSSIFTVTGPSVGASLVVSDGSKVFWHETATTKIWSHTGGTGSATAIVTTGIPSNATALAEQGDNLYITGSSTDPNIKEMDKAGPTATTVDSFTIRSYSTALVALDGKMYAMCSNNNTTEIREITPTTAAGAGYGRQFAKLPGISAVEMWTHSGQLFLLVNMTDSGDTAIMYMSTDGSYGTLGVLRPGDVVDSWDINMAVVGGNQRMLDHYVATTQRNATDTKYALWQIDAVSGGICNVAYAEDTAATFTEIDYIASFKHNIMFGGSNVGVIRVLRARTDQYMKDSNAIGPWHDFNLAEEKILSSLVLSTEDLPADWTVTVDYRVNGDSAWSSGITYSTTNGNGTKTAISTDASTKMFRTLQIRIAFSYTGAGVPTSAPVVQGVDVMAMVAKPQRVWRLLLDLSDGHSQAGAGAGHKKIENIKTASSSEMLVDFKDGYGNRDTNSYDQVDVVVDSYVLILTRPGEGYAAVTLKENP